MNGEGKKSDSVLFAPSNEPEEVIALRKGIGLPVAVAVHKDFFSPNTRVIEAKLVFTVCMRVDDSLCTPQDFEAIGRQMNAYLTNTMLEHIPEDTFTADKAVLSRDTYLKLHGVTHE